MRMQSGYFGMKNNDKWIDELMENLHLSDKADTNMRALSGGMKRRVLVVASGVRWSRASKVPVAPRLEPKRRFEPAGRAERSRTFVPPAV